MLLFFLLDDVVKWSL